MKKCHSLISWIRCGVITVFAGGAILIYSATSAAPAANDNPQAAEIPGHSPENEVFQFMTPPQSFTTKDHKTHTSTGYLWIPPACERVRGVLVFGQNIPEQWLAGHPDIRGVCEEQNLAILWTCPTLRMTTWAEEKDYTDEEKAKDAGAFLQQILDVLAEESGYSELSTVPWLPMGESMSLLVPVLLTNGYPERCIAGIDVKDGPWGRPVSPGVPLLIAAGTGAELNEAQYDIFTIWKEKATRENTSCAAQRAAVPTWPGSLLIEGGSAHFACTDAMCRLIAQYIRAVTKARLSPDGSPALLPVDLNTGYVAGLPVPGGAPVKPKPYSECTSEERNLPWYFDVESAQAAYDMANINWDAQPQLLDFTDSKGNPVPFDKKSGNLGGPVPFVTEEDGITFRVYATFLDKLPDPFAKAGAPLGHADGEPVIEWLCGPVIPLGANRFQIALDRSWGSPATFLRVWHPGDATYRLSTNPGQLIFNPNKTGTPQKITFDAIPDQKTGVKEISLHATSDSGMPVRFFVKAGPAEVHGDQLVFTPIPPRSKMPLTVTVDAWQWGRAAAPAVQTADLVERTFTISKE